MGKRRSKTIPISIRFTPEQRRLFEQAGQVVSTERGEAVDESTLIRELAVKAAREIVERAA